MSKKRTMQIDVIEEVKGTQFMQCKLYIDGNASVILMNKIDYERLLSDSFFVRDGKNRDSAGAPSQWFSHSAILQAYVSAASGNDLPSV